MLEKYEQIERIDTIRVMVSCILRLFDVTVFRLTNLTWPFDVYRLVEEFMLLANIFAANKIREAFPLTSLLRHHPAPKEKALSTVVEYLEKVGIHIDTSSAGQIYKSMMSYNCNDEIGAARMTVIMHLLVKPMMVSMRINDRTSSLRQYGRM